MPWSESFVKSWATLICDELNAECHYNAWSGFGPSFLLVFPWSVEQKDFPWCLQFQYRSLKMNLKMTGMVANCCGGSTLASDVWTRTIASLGSGDPSDPHGTIASNVWDFSQWKADAVVINLGTNDHLGIFSGEAIDVSSKSFKLPLKLAFLWQIYRYQAHPQARYSGLPRVRRWGTLIRQ
jgi:hypothetical protein